MMLMKELPAYLPLLFGFTVILTIAGFYFSCKSKTFLFIVVGYTILQSLLGLSGIYQKTEALPPWIMLLGIFPALVIIALTFLTPKGRLFIDGIQLKPLTYFHSMRIPVEITLALLFHQGVMSEYITYEGTNFDLLSGITAPFVAYLAFQKTSLRKKLLLVWNLLCLLLLLNVVVTAIFCIPSPFQKLAFEQPNIAVLYFPYSLLPTIVVPLVLFAHLVAFRNLLMNNNKK